MNRLKTLNLVLLTLLGLSSGISKIMQIPQEMAFFQGEMGFTSSTIVFFGCVQLTAGVLLIFEKTRMVGAIVLAATLFVSATIVFMAGKIGFGFFSLLPIVMAGFVIRECLNTARAESPAMATDL